MGAPKLGNKEERNALQMKMQVMKKTGMSYKDIAKELGVNPSTVGYYLSTRGKHAYKRRTKGFVSTTHRTNGVVSVLGSPKDSGTEATGFAAGYISGWLQQYAKEHELDVAALTQDVSSILRKEGR